MIPFRKTAIVIFALVILCGFAFAKSGNGNGNGNENKPETAGNNGKPDCVCPGIYAPICGTDGNTYGNNCVANCEGAKIAYRDQCRKILKLPLAACDRIQNETLRERCLNLTNKSIGLCDRIENEEIRERCLRALETPLRKCALAAAGERGACLKRLNFPFAQCANLTGNAQGQCLKSILAGPKPCDESDNETNVTECLRNTGFNLQVRACQMLGNESARKFCLKKLQVRDRVLKHECDEISNVSEWNGCVERLRYKLNLSECRGLGNVSEARECIRNKCEELRNETGRRLCYTLIKRFRWQNENINKLNSNINKLEAVLKYAGTRVALGEKWIERFDNRSANTTALKGIYNDFVAGVANANDSLASAKQYYGDGNYTEALDELKDALEFLKDAKLKWAEFREEARAILKELGQSVEEEPETGTDYE
ncbi:MAG: Kazal-type serine protease inhibitor domain-containing protein [Candidatus Micrarchaeota archaeon]